MVRNITISISAILSIFIVISAGLPWTATYTASYASVNNGEDEDNFTSNSRADNNFVILTFGNVPSSQYEYAKPILDRYDFKGSFFVVCNWIDSNIDGSRMTWQQIETLHNEGHDIQAKSMNHKRLTEIPHQVLEYEIGEPKECLQERGINPTVFGTPYGDGKDDPTVINTIAKYYDFAITGFADLMFLRCDGWKSSDQDDCRTFYDNGTLTLVNRYSIRESSQDSHNREYQGDNTKIFEEFVKEVNSQYEYNKDGNIKAIPIIAYHDFDDGTDPSSTDVELFEREIKYLYDNGFRVITMADLGYDEENHYLYIKDLL